MQIKKSSYATSDAAISRYQRAAASYVDNAMTAFTKLNPNVDSDILINYGAEILLNAVQYYGDQAAVVACAQYDQTMLSLGIQADSAEILNEMTEQQALQKVYNIYSNSSDSTTRLINALKSAASTSVLSAANNTIATNATRDYNKGVRWARVPSGAETCGFCVMLASRGFVYKSKDSATYRGTSMTLYHDNCDCHARASTENVSIEEYDPDAYLDVYYKAKETVLGTADATVKSKASGFDATDAICREISKRTKEWSYSGESASVTYTRDVSSTVQSVMETLASNGFEVSTTSSANSSLDITMSGKSWSVQTADTLADISSALTASSTARGSSHTGKQSSGGTNTILLLSAESSNVTRTAVQSALNDSMAEGEETLAIFNDGSLLRVTK